MKKERNCGCNGGYQPYGYQGQMIPQMGMMPQMTLPQMNNQMMMPNYNQNNYDQQINNLSNQIMNLERRVNSLENIVGNNGLNNSYNTSNFQMM